MDAERRQQCPIVAFVLDRGTNPGNDSLDSSYEGFLD